MRLCKVWNMSVRAQFQHLATHPSLWLQDGCDVSRVYYLSPLCTERRNIEVWCPSRTGLWLAVSPWQHSVLLNVLLMPHHAWFSPPALQIWLVWGWCCEVQILMVALICSRCDYITGLLFITLCPSIHEAHKIKIICQTYEDTCDRGDVENM